MTGDVERLGAWNAWGRGMPGDVVYAWGHGTPRNAQR